MSSPPYPLIRAPSPTYPASSFVATLPPLSGSKYAPKEGMEYKENVSYEVSLRENIVRTASPTPSEVDVLSKKASLIDWKKVVDFKSYTRRQIVSTVIIVLVIALVTAFLIEQGKIEDALFPLSNWLRDTPGAWLIPIAIMFVLSFPPLLGQEVVAVLVGDVWGLGIGFLIIATGTVLGELCNFLVFKWCCLARGKRVEEKNLKYALYSEVVRRGGLKIPIIMRFSVVPSHLSTAVFSTCGMSVWTFLASAILSLPKQLATVYVGTQQNTSGGSKTATTVKTVVLVLQIVVSLLAMRYITSRVDQVKADVVLVRQKARYAKTLQSFDLEAGIVKASDMDSINSVTKWPKIQNISSPL